HFGGRKRVEQAASGLRAWPNLLLGCGFDLAGLAGRILAQLDELGHARGLLLLRGRRLELLMRLGKRRLSGRREGSLLGRWERCLRCRRSCQRGNQDGGQQCPAQEHGKTLAILLWPAVRSASGDRTVIPTRRIRREGGRAAKSPRPSRRRPAWRKPGAPAARSCPPCREPIFAPLESISTHRLPPACRSQSTMRRPITSSMSCGERLAIPCCCSTAVTASGGRNWRQAAGAH